MHRPVCTENASMALIRFEGEIVMDAVQDFKADIEQFLEASNRPDIAIDLSRVTFMDSSGIGFLIGLRKRYGEGGRTLSLIAPTPPIKKLLDMLKLTDYFHVTPHPPAP